MLLVLGFALLAGCSSAATPLEPAGPPTLDPNSPVTSNDTPLPPIEPTPRVGEWIISEAMVESVELVFLESFPLQIHALVRGVLGDGCTELDQVTTTRQGNTFTIRITTARPADAVCTQIAALFEENVPLDVYGLPAGTYTVDANGVTATFTLDQDNTLDPPPGGSDQGGGSDPAGPSSGSGGVQTGLANVTDVEVHPTAAPPSAEVIIRGWLPNPCVQISGITETYRGGSVFQIVVETNEPTGVACIQVIQEFETSYTLQQIPGRGTYTLLVNDFATQFTIP